MSARDPERSPGYAWSIFVIAIWFAALIAADYIERAIGLDTVTPSQHAQR